MTNLRYPNNYFKNRGQGIRFKLEKGFLNKMQFYVYEEVVPIFHRFIKTRGATNNPKYFEERFLQMQNKFVIKLEEVAKAHFRDILKLSLTEKYGAWHKVPPKEVSAMLKLLMKQSKFVSKSKFLVRKFFNDAKPFFYPTHEQLLADNFPDNMMKDVVDKLSKGMSGLGRMVYTYSTYFINSAYEIQFRARDPKNDFRYIWGTRPDHRRTPQCELIEKKVNEEKKKKKEKGVTLDRLKEIVDKVANMPAFIKANPEINWVPHYNCRSGLERVV